MNAQQLYTVASIKTADNLRTIAQSPELRELSSLSLPEIDAVVDVIARVIPAGNVPGIILSGLARLPGRKLPLTTVKQNINLLFKGIEQTLDKVVYAAFFAGPAAVIWGYQNLLKLAGKDLNESFPDGIWQFYVDYALREDTARHATETCGFDDMLTAHQISLSAVDRVTAWVMAAIYGVHQYDNLLENEWRERVYTFLLRPAGADYAQLYHEWEKQRPYSRGADVAIEDDYPTYRRKKFDRFLAKATRHLSADLRRVWEEEKRRAAAHDFPAYKKQLSILAYLQPGPYGDDRVEIQPITQAHIGVIFQGHYYLIPVCAPNTDQPADVMTVRAQVATLMHNPLPTPPAQLLALVGLKRAALAELCGHLNHTFKQELERLQQAPILLNCDRRSRTAPLSNLRRAERGIGNHAITLFDTGETIVFDLSHIFFDGAWGATLAEIMTNEALAWANYLHTLPPAQPGRLRPASLACQLQAKDITLIRQAPQVSPEVGAETEMVKIETILTLRKRFKQRNDLLQLTVNDLLVLYRAMHVAIYQPNADLVTELKIMAAETKTQQAALKALQTLDSSLQHNPAIAIPVDASRRSPRERLYPMIFEVPADLDVLNLHRQVIQALDAYQSTKKKKSEEHTVIYTKFDRLQRDYLATLAGFGMVLRRAKDFALMGESASVGAIKLLANIPVPLQRMLDKIPARFDVLNDLIKGREVFSNVGFVPPTSTITRFMTAKDDNDKKDLAWGVVTDARGVMHISVRDFRPHVGLLLAVGREDVAIRIIRDYLEAYAHGLNNYVAELLRITEAGRETHLRVEMEENNDG